MRSTLARNGLLALIGTLLAALWLAGAASAAVFTVNDTTDADDATPGDGICATEAGEQTLRACITEANANEGSDEINVEPGRYVLSVGSFDRCNEEGDLDINPTDCSYPDGTGDLTIDGLAGTGDVIVDANGIDRVFEVFDAINRETDESFDVLISDLTITGGYTEEDDGAGIRNHAFDTTTLLRTRVTRNVADDSAEGGGIDNAGHLEVIESSVDRNLASDDGGGIYNTGELLVQESAIDSNHADSDGGGIWSSGPMTVTRSVVNDNNAEDDGGGIYTSQCCFFPSQPGALQNEVDGVSIENTTIDGNNADSNIGNVGDGGGIYVDDGLVTILNATISDNETSDDDEGVGGGIDTTESETILVQMKNTIVADNRQMGVANNCEGNIESQGNNLSNTEESDCNLTGPGDKPETEAGLARLADNGGPTRTRALLPGSAAREGADNEACPETDQRLADRPPPTGSAGENCDIGAYEADALADLLIEKLDGPDPAVEGGRLHYLLVAENDGPDTANGVTVQDTLPAGVTFLSATPSQGSCSGTSTVTCSLGSLAAGSHATVVIVVRPDSTGTKTNTASVSSVITDPDPGNNQDTEQTAVDPAPAGAAVAPQQQQCSTQPPRSSVGRSSLEAKRNTLRFTGRSTGFLCIETGLLGGVRRVRLAIARLLGGDRCRFLRPSGELGSARDCDRRQFVRARMGPERNGKVPWTFRRRRLDLPPGNYRIVVSAVDNQGQVETRLRRYNNKRFVIR